MQEKSDINQKKMDDSSSKNLQKDEDYHDMMEIQSLLLKVMQILYINEEDKRISPKRERITIDREISLLNKAGSYLSEELRLKGLEELNKKSYVAREYSFHEMQ